MSRIQPAGLAQDKGGVSAVLGAVLMFGLFVITLVAVQNQFVPVWQKEREAGLMQNVARQVSDIKAALDRQVGNQTQVPVTQPIALKSTEGFSFFEQKTLPGILKFTPAAAGAGLALSSNQLTIQSQNGQSFYGLGENWTVISGGTVSSISQIVHLRLRLVDPACVVASCSDPATLTLTMTDANAKCAGQIIIRDSVAGSDRTVEAQIYGPKNNPGATCNATPITIRDTDAKKQTNPPYYYLDAFDPELQFTSVMAGATYPVTLTMTTAGGAAGDYTIVYDSSSGGSRIGGTGLVVAPYAVTTAVGNMTVTKSNSQYPSQTYTLEYGALILDQIDGSAMVVAPQFAVSSASTQTSVSWSLPALTGSANSIAGASTATVTSTPSTRSFFTAFAPKLTFALSTSHPAVWKTFWDGALQNAGLSSASGQYNITTTATTATLTIYGPTTASGSTVNDLFLTFQTEILSIEIKATG